MCYRQNFLNFYQPIQGLAKLSLLWEQQSSCHMQMHLQLMYTLMSRQNVIVCSYIKHIQTKAHMLRWEYIQRNLFAVSSYNYYMKSYFQYASYLKWNFHIQIAVTMQEHTEFYSIYRMVWYHKLKITFKNQSNFCKAYIYWGLIGNVLAYYKVKL